MPLIKNRMVEIRMMAVLSIGLRAGMTSRSAMVRMHAPTISAALISLRVSGPISAFNCRALCCSPGIVAFSGLKNTMKKPHNAIVINQPIGNM